MAAAWPTVMTRLWVAFGLTPLEARMVSVNEPPPVGVPAMVAVPLLLAVKLSPAGSVPAVRVSAGTGEPVAVMVKLKAVPTVAVALAALVMAGAWFTVRTNDWV